MSEVELHIAGKTWMVACGPGEEARLTQLGKMIDAKLQDMHGNLSAQDSQNLLFAALLLADELDEARGSAAQPVGSDDVLAPQLELLADALENCATKLESSLTEH